MGKLIDGRVVELGEQDLEIIFNGMDSIKPAGKSVMVASLKSASLEELVNQIDQSSLLDFIGEKAITAWLEERSLSLAAS